MHEGWQDVDAHCHLCHLWRDIHGRIITAMTMTVVFLIVLVALGGLAALAGLGVGHLGADSREIEDRDHRAPRQWPTLTPH